MFLIIFLVQAEGEVAALNRRIQLLEEVNIDLSSLQKKDIKRHSTNYHKQHNEYYTSIRNTRQRLQDLERSEERLATATQKLAEASHAADESER